MTVEDLIEKLEMCNPLSKVILNMGMNDLANSKEVKAVNILSARRYLKSAYWSDNYYPEDIGEDEVQEVVVNLLS